MPSREEIRRIKKRVEQELLKRPGVTGVDINYKTVNGVRTDTLAIVVYVKKKRDVTGPDRIPAEIEGVPTDIVEGTFKTMARAKSS